jgi:3-carboxy-cis,cis-muconate cycloisomerase
MSVRRFELLLELYGDEDTIEIFSERATVQYWLDVESSLALAQAELGIIDYGAASAIAVAADAKNIDLSTLWADARNVGYPILPLIRQLDALLAEEHRGCVHFGATTQDIMDTGVALQVRDVAKRQDSLIQDLGDCLADLVREHAQTMMAARTHGQHAVPTVLGLKLAVYLDEFSRHRTRLAAAFSEVVVLALFGAGGTSAAYGHNPVVLRERVAGRLGLRPVDVPRHVARDTLAALTSAEAAIAATCSRFGREVIDLSRSEIGEITEAVGHLRGASSTMPQKSNPIESEGVVGLAVCAAAQSAAMLRAMEAGHERAAGEWQVEWHALPEVLILCSSAIKTLRSIVQGLRVFPERMGSNLLDHGGEVMAEAYMISLAPEIGRENAHELVYEAVRRARETHITLFEAMVEMAPSFTQTAIREIHPEEYLGDSVLAIEVALKNWDEGEGLLKKNGFS